MMVRTGVFLGVLFLMIVSSGEVYCQDQSGVGQVEQPSLPLIVAHRGASADAPENTLPAFRLAWQQKADAIEGDFHLTKDGHIVCIHDKDTDNYCDQNLVVKKSTLKQLRSLDVGKKFDRKFAGTKIPTIDEVFRTVPKGKKIYVEVKCGPEIIPELLKKITESRLSAKQIVLISFQASVIAEFKKHRKDIKACWLTGFKKGKSGNVEPNVQTILKTITMIHADGFSSSKNGIVLPVIQRVKKEGFEYHVWTVDDPAVALKFLKWGAQSVTTNKPGMIRRKLSFEKRFSKMN